MTNNERNEGGQYKRISVIIDDDAIKAMLPVMPMKEIAVKVGVSYCWLCRHCRETMPQEYACRLVLTRPRQDGSRRSLQAKRKAEKAQVCKMCQWTGYDDNPLLDNGLCSLCDYRQRTGKELTVYFGAM